jgi:hypothetical protein
MFPSDENTLNEIKKKIQKKKKNKLKNILKKEIYKNQGANFKN